MDTDTSNVPFAMVPLSAARQQKPRTAGLTMMMDWGLGLNRVADHLRLAGPYADLVKIVVGTARLYPRDYLEEKLALYKQHGVAPFIGGQFAEYVYATQGMAAIEPFFAEAKALGFEAVEVSDNCVPLNEKERRAMIRTGIDCGLEVHGEVGSKVQHQAAEELIAQAEVCLDAGCHTVLVEGAELVTREGEPIGELISALRAGLDLDKVLFELTGPWIKGNALCDVYQLKMLLFAEFGPNINLANVMPDDVIETEAMRAGLSVAGPPVSSQAAG